MIITIADYEKKIEAAKKRIETNKNNPKFFEPNTIIGMHDTDRSDYENELATIKYCESQILRIKEEAEKEKEKEKQLILKAKKLNLTLEAYKEKLEKEKKEKALKAKIKRYHAELKELEKRKIYLEKWLKENEED